MRLVADVHRAACGSSLKRPLLVAYEIEIQRLVAILSSIDASFELGAVVGEGAHIRAVVAYQNLVAFLKSDHRAGGRIHIHP